MLHFSSELNKIDPVSLNMFHLWELPLSFLEFTCVKGPGTFTTNTCSITSTRVLCFCEPRGEEAMYHFTKKFLLLKYISIKSIYAY